MVDEAAAPERSVVPLSTTVALLVGGAVSIGVLVLGMLILVTSSFPYAFGFDGDGDRPYPFPTPEGIPIGLAIVAVGILTLAGLVAWSRGRGSGRIAATVGLLGTIVLAVLVTSVTNHARSCPVDIYSGREMCAPSSMAFVRDLGFLLVLPLVAMVSMWWGGVRRRR